MVELSVPQVNFSSLGELPKIYREAQTQRARQDTLASLGQNPDYSTAAAKLMAAGDVQGAMSLAQLGNNQRDFQFRQQEAQRTQGNADRSFGLQQQTANTAQIQTVKDAQGNERLVRIDRQGNATPIDTGAQPAQQANPYAPGGKFTESQAKDALYASRMFASEKILRDPKVESAATAWGESALEGTPYIPSAIKNWAHSKEFQQYDQAQRDFINATLRRESGAVIADSEFANAKKQYFPQPGDTKEVLAQKRANRAEAIRGIASGAGPAYRPESVFADDGSIVPNPATKGQSPPRGAGKPTQVTSKQQFDALPSGTQFIAPDGSTRIKP